MVLKRGDRRIQRTRRMLRDALFALILEKGFEAVTVDEITARADVGRTTFYLHYKDKDELLLESIDSMVADLIAQVSALPLSSWQEGGSSSETGSIRTPILLVFQHAAENATLYEIIMRGEGATKEQSRLRLIIAGAVEEFIRVKGRRENLVIHPLVPLEVFSSYFAASLLGFVSWWLESGRPYPPEDMAEMFRQMFFPGARNVLGVAFP